MGQVIRQFANSTDCKLDGRPDSPVIRQRIAKVNIPIVVQNELDRCRIDSRLHQSADDARLDDGLQFRLREKGSRALVFRARHGIFELADECRGDRSAIVR